MIFDLEKMTSCNDKWIFYNDDTRRAITPDMIPEILRYLTGELQYYSRLYDDFAKRYEIVSARLDIAQAKNNIYGDCAELCSSLYGKRCTYSDILDDTIDRCYNLKKCLRLLTGSEW